MPQPTSPTRHLRSAVTPTLVFPLTRQTTLGDRAFPLPAARAWNALHPSLRAVLSLTTFRRRLKTELFDQNFWSPRLARSHYCQQLTLSVCHKNFKLFLPFVSQWNRTILWPSVLHDPLYKTLFFDFWFRPPNAQNLLPKNFWAKNFSPWNRAIFWPSVLHDPLYKTLFFDFSFRPHNLLRKICTKSPR